jgi:hypothetical protein
VFGNQDLLAVLDEKALGRVVDRNIYPVSDEALPDQFGNLRVFAQQDARRHFDLRHLAAEAGEGLRQFATNRPAAEHHQALGQFAQIPHGVGSQAADLAQAGNRRHERPRAGGNDDAARAQALGLAVAVGDVDFPWRNDLRRAFDDLNAQFGVALDRIMRRNVLNHPLHALHRLGEIEFGLGDC